LLPVPDWSASAGAAVAYTAKAATAGAAMACVLCLVPAFPVRAAGRSRLARLLPAGKGMVMIGRSGV